NYQTSYLLAKYQEYAAFADFTYRFTDQFDVQVGGRESHITAGTGPNNRVGVYYGATGIHAPELIDTASPFTYLLKPRYKLSPDFMLYARLASAFRSGMPNNTPVPNAPVGSAPDKTYNYEVGLKGDLLDHQLVVDASVYYINWKDIQLTIKDPTTGVNYLANG